MPCHAVKINSLSKIFLYAVTSRNALIVGNKGYLQSEIRTRAAKGMGRKPRNSSMYHICIKVILFHRLFNNAFNIETIQCQMGL